MNANLNDTDKIKAVESFISKLGFPVVIALIFVGFAIWSQVESNKRHKSQSEIAKEQTNAARNQTESMSQVIIESTKSRVEMASAIRSLERSSNENTTTLRSLEMSIQKKRSKE